MTTLYDLSVAVAQHQALATTECPTLVAAYQKLGVKIAYDLPDPDTVDEIDFAVYIAELAALDANCTGVVVKLKKAPAVSVSPYVKTPAKTAASTAKTTAAPVAATAGAGAGVLVLLGVGLYFLFAGLK